MRVLAGLGLLFASTFTWAVSLAHAVTSAWVYALGKMGGLFETIARFLERVVEFLFRTKVHIPLEHVEKRPREVSVFLAGWSCVLFATALLQVFASVKLVLGRNPNLVALAAAFAFFLCMIDMLFPLFHSSVAVPAFTSRAQMDDVALGMSLNLAPGYYDLASAIGSIFAFRAARKLSVPR